MTERWSAPAAPASVGRLRNAVGTFARQAGLPSGLVGDVKLAVSEALTNAVVHGYRGGSPRGELVVRAALRARHLEVVVEDGGVGMAPRPDSPGMGVGMPLIASLAEESSVKRRAGGGTVVRMRFPRG
ncbi:MAG: ATP-binding protein [Solirubrobacterales bacterium]|nr:ATP-binding protein [Solirubrobacterales bacterium]